LKPHQPDLLSQNRLLINWEAVEIKFHKLTHGNTNKCIQKCVAVLLYNKWYQKMKS